MNPQSVNLSPDRSKHSVRYVLERPEARVEFLDRPGLLEFLRESLPPHAILSEDATVTDLAAFAARRRWTLLEFASGEYVQVTALLERALNTIDNLLSTTELNMDDLEPSTRVALEEAARFQSEAARQGFPRNCDMTLPPT